MTETKLQISERLYEKVYNSCDIAKYNESDFHTSMWVNPSLNGYFRLSLAGFNNIVNTGEEYYTINEITRFGFENLKRLKFYSDNLQVPYYLVPDSKIQVYSSLIIFDKKIATISKFYDNFEKYLEKAKPKDK